MSLRTPSGESTSGETTANSGETKPEFFLNTCTCLLLRLNPPAFFDKLINRAWVQLTYFYYGYFHEPQLQFLVQNRVCDGHVDSL